MNKELKRYIKLSEESALERFNQDYPDLEIDKIKVLTPTLTQFKKGDRHFETEITIAKQKVNYGDSW